jgi:hypothetical protein
MQPFGLFYGHLVYFMVIWYIVCMAIWYILWQFDIPYGRLVYFMDIWYIFPFWYDVNKNKSGNPGAKYCGFRRLNGV